MIKDTYTPPQADTIWLGTQTTILDISTPGNTISDVEEDDWDND